MRRWAKVVVRALVVVVAVLLLFMATTYANAWYQRSRAGHLLAVLKTMTPGVTTEAEYMNAVGPLRGSAQPIDARWPRDISIGNFPRWKWFDRMCSSERLQSACYTMAKIMPVGTLFDVSPTFADGKLARLRVWEGQIPLRSRCCAFVKLYANRYESNDMELPENFSGYYVAPFGEGNTMLLTAVTMDERATPAERDSALNFSFRCFTTYRTCRDGAQFLRPLPSR